eukprot:10636500-Ditylum_brightwellii.AAC.1
MSLTAHLTQYCMGHLQNTILGNFGLYQEYEGAGYVLEKYWEVQVQYWDVLYSDHQSHHMQFGIVVMEGRCSVRFHNNIREMKE